MAGDIGEARAETPPDEPESRDPVTRTIAVSLAAVVLLGAVLAILQTDASARESTTARETTRAAVRAMRANVTQGSVEAVQAQLQGERASLAYRRPLIEDATSLTDAVGLPHDSAAIARNLRAAQRELPIGRTRTALSNLEYETERLTQKQQALATTRITWNTRATQYTTVIAVLAAALFLVGFGLIVEGKLRRYSYALGVVIALTAAAWGAWIYQLPIPSTPDGTIDATARAAVRTSASNYEGAISAYSQAIALDDEYAPAYRGRAIARFLAANPDYPTTRAFTDAVGRKSVAGGDAQRAIELEHGRDFLALSIAALQDFYSAEFQRTVDRADDAIDINDTVPDVRLLKSAAETALGDDAAARASFTAALDLLRGSAPTQRIRLLASSYLTYLEWVMWVVPDRAPAAKRLATQTVATETAFTLDRRLSGKAPPGAKIRVQELRYADGELRVRLSFRNLPPRTAATALVYERPLRNGPWAQPPALAVFINESGSGTRSFTAQLDEACQPTAVRLDIYLNGAPALSRTGPGVSSPTC